MAEVKVLNNFIIRKATIKDLKDILRLNRELYLEEYKKFDKPLNNWTYSKEGRNFFRNAIVKKNNFCEVVENNNKIIGYLNGGIVRKNLWRNKEKGAYLGSIFIGKKFRDRGFGSGLVKNFINWCKKNSVDYLSVTASAQNNLGINFYRKTGFKDYDLTLQIKI